ncbi:MAG: ABC transporter ATP-binding protein [Acidobacteria bacterium]|nr:ABC transporter ATP-binding protein [Acidobacteriota bacterium]
MIPAIAVEGLHKRFLQHQGVLGGLLPGRRRPPVCALDGLTLEVAPGTVHGLLGPNGAGKSTLLKILATLVLPDSGCARVAGFDTAKDAQAVRRRLGVMLESERSFFARLSGRRNLEFFAALWGLGSARARSRVGELLELVGLAEDADRRFITYSLGMQHRLGLARALLPGPAVLLLDEPTRSLDPAAAHDWGRLLRDDLARGQGKAVLLASHNLAEVEKVCDRISILVKGKIVAAGSHEELLRRFDCARLEQVYRKAVGGPKGRGGAEDG